MKVDGRGIRSGHVSEEWKEPNTVVWDLDCYGNETLWSQNASARRTYISASRNTKKESKGHTNITQRRAIIPRSYYFLSPPISAPLLPYRGTQHPLSENVQVDPLRIQTLNQAAEASPSSTLHSLADLVLRPDIVDLLDAMRLEGRSALRVVRLGLPPR